MGDARFDEVYARVANAPDAGEAIRLLTDEEVAFALAAASRRNDPYLANVLATEAANRANRKDAALSIADSLGDGVVAVDRDGLVTFLNPMAETLLGWAANELLGRDLHAVFHPWSAPADAGPCSLVAALNADRPLRGDDAFTVKDGTLLPVAFTSSPLVDGRDVEGAVLVFRTLRDPDRADRVLTERTPCAAVPTPP